MRVYVLQYLGVILTSKMSWSTHIDHDRHLSGFLYQKFSFNTTRPGLTLTFFKLVIFALIAFAAGQ